VQSLNIPGISPKLQDGAVAYYRLPKNAIDRCKYPAYTQDNASTDRVSYGNPSQPQYLISLSSRRTCVAQKSLSPVQAEESTRCTPESFLHTILQYSNKRSNSHNEDSNSEEGMICAKIPNLENDVLECSYSRLGGQLRWRVDNLR
jgi:hypothetical protein